MSLKITYTDDYSDVGLTSTIKIIEDSSIQDVLDVFRTTLLTMGYSYVLDVEAVCENDHIWSTNPMANTSCTFETTNEEPEKEDD